MTNDTPDETKPKLLVTGASGLLGHAVCTLAQQTWSVYGVYRRHRPPLSGIHKIQADLTDPDCPKDLLGNIRPHAVIHTAANADVTACEQYPQKSEPINVVVPEKLAELCCQAGADYLFTSTDLVFDGLHAPYDESAATRAVCVYGEQKINAEQAVLNVNPAALVCRLPLMFGVGPYAHRHFCIQMIQAIRNGTPLKLFVDEYRTPVDIESAAQGLLTLLGRAAGLYHLGGQTRISRYDFGLALAKSLNIRSTRIDPVRIDEVPLSVPRAGDCSLVSQKAYRLGYAPLFLDQGVRNFIGLFERLSGPPQ